MTHLNTPSKESLLLLKSILAQLNAMRLMKSGFNGEWI